jgi:hypothetical protein
MLVLAFGDVLVFVLMQTVDVPLLQIMGGVRLSESERIIADVAISLIALSVLTAPIWLIGAAVAIFGAGDAWRLAVLPQSMGVGVSRGLKALVVASLAIWGGILPITQPEQQLRTQVDRLFEQKKFDAAIEVMEAAGPDAFPPHWTPPPRMSRQGIDVPVVVEMLTRLEQPGSPEWLRDIYWVELEDALQRRFSFRSYWSGASNAERLALVELFEQQPHERLQELFDGEQPIAISSVEEQSDPDLKQELEERFNALFDKQTTLQSEDLAEETSANEGPESASAVAQ